MKKLKKDLVNSLSSKLSLEKDEITQIVDTVLDGVKEILSEGSSLEIRGFGTFEVKIRKGKKNARNPKTGEKVQTQPHYVICLKLGQELKDNIKKNYFTSYFRSHFLFVTSKFFFFRWYWFFRLFYLSSCFISYGKIFP